MVFEGRASTVPRAQQKVPLNFSYGRALALLNAHPLLLPVPCGDVHVVFRHSSIGPVVGSSLDPAWAGLEHRARARSGWPHLAPIRNWHRALLIVVVTQPTGGASFGGWKSPEEFLLQSCLGYGEWLEHGLVEGMVNTLIEDGRGGGDKKKGGITDTQGAANKGRHERNAWLHLVAGLCF